jgi:hypothetical protein
MVHFLKEYYILWPAKEKRFFVTENYKKMELLLLIGVIFFIIQR